MIKTRAGLTMLLYAAAVLAMLAGTMCVAQQSSLRARDSVSGVIGPVDDSFHDEVGVSIGGSSEGNAQSRNESASSWAPARYGADVTGKTSKMRGAKREEEAQEQTTSGQMPTTQESTMQESSKRKKTKKRWQPAGMGVGAGRQSASSFGGSFTDEQSMFAFTGKLQSAGNGSGEKHERAEERKFAEAVGRSGSGGHSFQRREGKGSMSKTPEPKGEQTCDHASRLHLCNWL